MLANSVTSTIAQQEKEFQLAVQPGSPISALLTSTIAQQEKEFQHAVQPGSPISALLSSARNKELDAQKARIVAQMAPSAHKEVAVVRTIQPRQRKHEHHEQEEWNMQ
jgi:hypothetical protein